MNFGLFLSQSERETPASLWVCSEVLSKGSNESYVLCICSKPGCPRAACGPSIIPTESLPTLTSLASGRATESTSRDRALQHCHPARGAWLTLTESRGRGSVIFLMPLIRILLAAACFALGELGCDLGPILVGHL